LPRRYLVCGIITSAEVRLFCQANGTTKQSADVSPAADNLNIFSTSSLLYVFSSILGSKFFNIINQKFFFNVASLYLFVESRQLFVVNLLFRLSQVLHSTQLVDIFSYDSYNTPSALSPLRSLAGSSSSLLVFLFANFVTNIKFFLFTLDDGCVKSTSFFFKNANWLEREVSEMNGILFRYKQDARNLLLPYGECLHPLKKSFPVTGFTELFYFNTVDSICSVSINLE